MASIVDSVDEKARVLRFRTAAGMISRLGSEQLKDHFTAVIELVKNAYDADATVASIELRDTDGEQLLRIQDDGTGMTLEDLHGKWACLATENKLREDRSPVFRRRRLGQKGVGRFAAEKLGRCLVLRTRTAGDDRVRQVRFDWEALKGDRELREYEFRVTHTKSDNFEPSHGTRLDIRGLRIGWRKVDMAKLRTQLSTLIDPDATATDFRIRLSTPWQDLDGFLSNPLPGNETHRIEFRLDQQGREHTTVWDQGNVRQETNVAEALPFGPLRGILRYYGRGIRKAEASRGGSGDADWNVGVRIFRDGCRVRPYGEPGPEGDWLQIYRTRYLKGSRFRLKPHYLEGAVYVSKDSNPLLRDTTSREGLEENDAYHALVDYIQAKVAILSEILREEELREERQRIRERYVKALEPLTGGLSRCASDAYRRAVDSADRMVRKVLRGSEAQPLLRNAHWECLDCRDSWKVPRELTPVRCRQHSVGKDGKPTFKPGCGSSNIRRKENVPRGKEPEKADPFPVDEVMAGAPAYVSGIQLRPVIDWDMGERDYEAEVRPERRELAINGRHPAFRTADALDGTETAEGTDIEALRAVAGLTMHIIDSASLAWGRWHFLQSSQFDAFTTRYAELKEACLNSLRVKLAEHASPKDAT
jgi:hypothetical protein